MMDTMIDWSSPHTYLSIIFFLLTIVLVVLQPKIPFFPRVVNITREYTNLFRKQTQNNNKGSSGQECGANGFTPVVVGEIPKQCASIENSGDECNAQRVECDACETHQGGINESIAPENVCNSGSISGTAGDTEWSGRFGACKRVISRVKSTRNKLVRFMRRHFIIITIDLMWAPILSLLVLLATGTCTLEAILIGIGGNEHVKSYSVLVLFMSLSYVCISLDASGIFKVIAYWIVRRTGSNKWLMFFCFGAFSSVLTIFTSNDIVILTLTPIICYVYLQNKEEFNPLPFVFCQFFMANIWSITLQIGNPTNIIVAEAYQMNFVEYSAWMIIPAIASGTLCFVLLALIFHRQLRSAKKQERKPDNKDHVLVANEQRSKLSETINLGGDGDVQNREEHPTIEQNEAHQIAQAEIPPPIQEEANSKDHEIPPQGDDVADGLVTYDPSLDPDFIVPTWDLSVEVDDTAEVAREIELGELSLQREPNDRGNDVDSNLTFEKDTTTSPALEPVHTDPEQKQRVDKISATIKIIGLAGCLITLTIVSFFAIPSWIVCLVVACTFALYDLVRDAIMITRHHVHNHRQRKRLIGQKAKRSWNWPRIKKVLRTFFHRSVLIQTIVRMPWKVVPFALGLFVYVELLSMYHWVDGIAYVLVHTIEFVSLQSSDGSSLLFTFSSVLVVAIFGALACNVLNNQPMTILFTTVMKSSIVEDYFQQKPHSSLAKQGALLSLIISSNFGANLTIIGALAGIMWLQLLRQNQVSQVTYWTFLKYGLMTTPIVILATSAVLTAELMFMGLVQQQET